MDCFKNKKHKQNLLYAKRLISENEEHQAKQKLIGKKYNREIAINHIKLISQYETRENFFLLCISSNDIVLNLERVARGSLHEVGVHLRDLLTIALSYPTKKIVVFHNHPDSTCDVSRNDLILYRELFEIMDRIENTLLDSYVIGNDGISSTASLFKKANLLNSRK